MALRGHVFDKQLFSSDCYALVTDTFLGKQSGIIRGCDMTHTTSLIHINEGYFVVKGRPIQEEGGSNIEVEPGNIDGSYCKLVCELDMSKNNTTTELNQVSYKIIEDVTNYPVLTQEDITDNGTIYQFELAKFRRTLNGIEDFVDTRSFLNFDSIYEEVRNEIKKIEDGSIFVTEEEMREVGVAVSPTQPTTNEKVWIQKGKNLLNKDNANIIHYYLSSGALASWGGAYTLYIPCQPNTTYTIQKIVGYPFEVWTTSTIPVTGVKNIDYVNGSGKNSVTITTSKTAKYLCVYYYNTDCSLTEEELRSSIQIELGSTATEYEAYVEKAIHTKNDNGVYEEFVNQTEIQKTLEDLKGKLLWSNGSYTSAFAAQTVNIDLSDYNFIRVIYTHWGGSWSFLDGGKVPKGVMSMLNPSASTSRRYTSNNEGVTFENPANDGNTLAQVPIYIIGYKYW